MTLEWCCSLQRVNYQSTTDTVRADHAVGGASPQSMSRAHRTVGPGHLVRTLLRDAAAPRTAALQWEGIDERQIEHIIKAGLAPLLWRVAQDVGAPPPLAWRDTLRSADLVAQVVYGNVCDATTDLVDACRAGGALVTLLKGVSIGGQYYPAAHLRPMGDIDLLVTRRDRAWVELTMLRRGYVRMDGYEPEMGDAHGAPLYHPELRVWVEIHTALFPEADRLRRNRLFGPPDLERHIVPSSFENRRVGRLRAELQLVYIASYWIRDMTKEGVHASFARPLLDAVYLLAGSARDFDWDGMLDGVDNDVAAASLYGLLHYVSTRGLAAVPERILVRLAKAQHLVGGIELAVIARLTDACLVGQQPRAAALLERHPMIGETLLECLFARGSHAAKLVSLPWALLFPPQIAERYTWGYHRDRFRRLVAGKR
jgi:Uncharacterised nucleotidyltransferase